MNLIAASLVILWSHCCKASTVDSISVSSVKAHTNNLQLSVDLTTGSWSAGWGISSAKASLTNVSSSVTLTSGVALDTRTAAQRLCSRADVTKIKSKFGTGIELTIHYLSPGKPDLLQKFDLYDNLPYLLTSVCVRSSSTIGSNHMVILSCDSTSAVSSGAHLDLGGQPQTLAVPYDNDAFVRYSSSGVPTSYEVTALYDNESRHGFVIGSITHDTWKTGLKFGAVGDRHVGDLTVYGGAADANTRDTQPHGAVTGSVIESPIILVGWFSDWRQGLETYGAANAIVHPPISWSDGVPFGWNSWMAYENKISEADYLSISDFYKNQLVPRGFSNHGRVYLNLDSYWDNMTDSQLKLSVAHVHANHQKAGIYWTPFVDWAANLNTPVPGTGGSVRYSEIVLRGSDGLPVPRVDGAEPLDATNPNTLKLIDFELARFVALGFDYIKLDFLTHGAIEGQHYNPAVSTGTQAYNIGMQRIVNDLSPKHVGRNIFISLSIAPLFPSGYGHSRRIACDTWGWLSNSEYLLNSLTYGWWEEGSLYKYIDPDNVELIEQKPLTTKAEGRTRLNASVIAGTVLLDSDPLTEHSARQRALDLLTNRQIDTLASSGDTFAPVEGNTGSAADTTFVYLDPKSGINYVAVFNFSATDSEHLTLALARLGLRPDVRYKVYDLWSHQSSAATQTLNVELLPGESTILRLTTTHARNGLNNDQ